METEKNHDFRPFGLPQMPEHKGYLKTAYATHLEKIEMKYSEVFREAWKSVLDEFETGITCIESEADLQCLLFAECMKILRKNPARPIPVHRETEVPHASGRFDLALGPKPEALVEVKFNMLDYEEKAKQDLDKLEAAFRPPIESIFLCLTKNIENQDSVKYYLEALPSRMQKEGFQVVPRFVRHPMHEKCYANSPTNSEIHCAILIWKES